MNGLVMEHVSYRRYYRSSWAGSLFFHGVLVWSSIAFINDIRLAPQPSPFKWQVALVEPPPNPTPPTPPQPIRSEPVPKPPQPVEPQPVARTVQTVQTVQRVEQTVHQETRAVAQAVQTVESHPQNFSQAMRQADAAVQSVSPAQIVDTGAIAHFRPAAKASDQAGAVVANMSGVSHTSPAVHATAGVRTIGEVVSEPTVLTAFKAVVSQTAPVPAPSSEPSSVREVKVRSTPTPRNDYGWLTETLRARVEERKGYPHLARVNRWEGTVMIRVRMKPEGERAMLEEVSVEESSGYSVLDAHALEVVRQAFPLPLKYALDRSIDFRVPIGFKMAD